MGGGEEALLDGKTMGKAAYGTVGVDEKRVKLLGGRRPQNPADQLDGEGASPPPPEEQDQRRECDSGVRVDCLTEQLPRPLAHLPDPVGTPHDDQRQQRPVSDGLLKRGLPDAPVTMTQRDSELRLSEPGRRIRLAPQGLVQPDPRARISETDLLVHL